MLHAEEQKVGEVTAYFSSIKFRCPKLNSKSSIWQRQEVPEGNILYLLWALVLERHRLPLGVGFVFCWLFEEGEQWVQLDTEVLAGYGKMWQRLFKLLKLKDNIIVFILDTILA